MLTIQKPHHIAILLLVILLAATNCNGGDKVEPSQEGDNQKSTPQEPSKQDRLAKLVQEEKRLEETAKQLLQELQQEKGPSQSVLRKYAKNLEKDIAKATKDPKKAEKVVNRTKRIQEDLEILVKKLKEPIKQLDLRPFDPIIRDMFDAVLKTPEIEKAKKENRPIDSNKLSGDDKAWYQSIIKKYNEASTNVGVFIIGAFLEDVRKLIPVTEANLALFKNIQQQHELKKAAANQTGQR
jgi:DNA repair exonuclease SbcCD ATPase subunit